MGSTDGLRVRVLIRRFEPVIGGMERQCHALCQRWAAAGMAVEVWTRHIVPGTPARQMLDGFTVRRIRPGGVGRAGEYGSLPVIARHLVGERAQYDVVAVFGSGWLALAAGWAARAADRPWLFRPATAGDVTRFLDPAAAPAGGPIRRWLRGHIPPTAWRARALRNAGAVVAVSDEIAAELGRWGFAAHRVRHIPNGVDTVRFRPADGQARAEARAALGLPADALIALFLGRLVARKGVMDLVASWQVLNAEVGGDLPDAQLIIAGSGAGQQDSVERLLVERVAAWQQAVAAAAPGAGATTGIHLVGPVIDPAPWLAASDIFVLPSHSEGLSNALLEAMASGLAVVASDLPSTRAATVHGTAAWLYPPGDVGTLAAGLRRALTDPAGRVRMGQAARARVEADYSLDVAAGRYRDVFAELAG